MMYRKLMGSILPKNIDDSIDIKDYEMKANIEILYQQFQHNISNCLWTLEDYKNFRSGLGKLEESVFKESFPFILEIASLNKQQITDYYLELDKTFQMNIYENTQQPTIKDIMVIVRQLASKKLKMQNIILDIYDEKFYQKKDLKEQIVDLELLLEKLNNGDSDIVSIIENRYNSLIELAKEDSCLIKFLEISVSDLINDNKLRLKQKIKFCYASLNRYTEMDLYKECKMHH